MNQSTTQANVDPAEIQKFSDLASRWWDTESEFKPLHQINPLRLDYIIKQSGELNGKSAIDVGCGGGILADSLSARGAKVSAIDMSEAALAVARLHQLESGQTVNYEQLTAEEKAQQNAAGYALVTCMEMLEHVPSPESVVAACAKLCQPGGDLFFSTINRTAKAFAFAIVGAEYLLKLLPRGTHEYAKFIRPHELIQWARNAGLELQSMTGMHYNPLSGQYSSAPGVDVNYLLHFRKAK